MSSPQHPLRKGVSSAIVLLLAGGLFWVFGQSSAVPVPTAEFCFTSPPQARASVDEAADALIAVSVPLNNPLPGATDPKIDRVEQDVVVQFLVQSDRPGGVAVHGLVDLVPLGVGTTTKVAFRTIHSGRFPLHFHASDGSHFEIAALEIEPRSHR